MPKRDPQFDAVLQAAMKGRESANGVGHDGHGDAYEDPQDRLGAAPEPDEEPTRGLVEWPKPPAAAAYRGLIGEVIELIEPHTEADPAAILTQLLVAFGNVAGRTAFYPVGPKRHYPNLYAILVGRTAYGRKGTAFSWVEALMGEAAPGWLKECVLSGLSSGEGLIHALRDEEPGKDKRVLAVEEEFGGTLRLMARDGNILSSVLRQAFDGDRLRVMTRNNPLRAEGVHVSVVGHVTKPELLECLGQTNAANGFANRFLWACARRSKLLPDGGDRVDLSRAGAELRAAAQFAAGVTCMDRTKETAKLWRENYGRLSAERPGLFGFVVSRAAPLVLRLAVIYALLDRSRTIRADHLRAALAFWDFAERSCEYVFGRSSGNADADHLLAELRSPARAAAGMTRTEISAFFNRNKSREQIDGVLAVLNDQGQAAREAETVDGRRVERWRAVKGYEINEINEVADRPTTYGDTDG